MTDNFASAYVYQLRHGPSLAPKKVTKDWEHGEVRIIVPADPEKVAQYRKHLSKVKKRRKLAGLAEDMNVWGKR